MKQTTICLLIVALHHVVAAQGGVDPALSIEWSLVGRWTGVATDKSTGVIYVIGFRRAAEIDGAGQIRREFSLAPDTGRTLRLGKFPAPALVTFTTWGPPVTTYDLDGNRLWTYPRETGVDSVWSDDLDGDGSDEVVIGYNGGTGVHVLDGKGQLLWKDTGIGNVWQVGVGDVLGLGRPQVVTTSSAGQVHVFDGSGKTRVDVVARRAYLTMVRAHKLPGDAAATILAAGTDQDSKATTVMALRRDGASKWRLNLSSAGVVSADVATARPWLALGTREERVVVVNAVNGVVLGAAERQGSAEVAWFNDPPLLLVATGTELTAFRVPSP